MIRFVGFPPANGGRWRSLWPADALQAAGLDARAGTDWPAPTEADIVIAHRPIGRQGVWWVKVHQHAGAKVLVQVDDDMDHIPDWNGSKPGYTAAKLDGHRKAIERADGLIVSTPRLAELYGPLARRTWVLRNLIPDWVRKCRARPSTPAVRVGWMGMVSVHKGDLHWIRPAADQMFRGAMFETVGDARVPRHIGANCPVETWPWMADDSGRALYRKMARADIGIVPLDPDESFNLSKSFIKALEFMILGKPVVVTNLPEQAELVRHGVDGFLADTPAAFAEFVQSLVWNPDLRATMGANAQDRAREWTLETRGHQWPDVIGELRGRKSKRTKAQTAAAETAGRESGETPNPGSGRASAGRPEETEMAGILPGR